MGAAGDEKAAAAAAGAGAAGAEGEGAVDSKVLQQQSKALDKLTDTDHVEDRQLDSSRVQSAKAERMKRRAQEKTAKKLASAQVAAREKRAQAEAKLNRRAARAGGRAKVLRRTGHLPSSSSSVFSLKLPLMCS